MDHEITLRTIKGKHPNVLRSYLRFRKEAQREGAKKMRLWPREKRTDKDKSVYGVFQQCEKKQRHGEDAAKRNSDWKK